MLMTAGKQPGLISCDWAERSPGSSDWWIQILHMLIINGEQYIHLHVVCTSQCQ